MYILNIDKAIRKMTVNEMKTLSLNIVIKELDFLKKTVIIQRNA